MSIWDTCRTADLLRLPCVRLADHKVCLPALVQKPRISLRRNSTHRRKIPDFVNRRRQRPVVVQFFSLDQMNKCRRQSVNIVRIVQANFFSRLIKENWEGIKSVSDEEKKALLGMLDPTLLSTDIRMLRLIILMLLWGFGLSVVINRSIAVFKLLRASRIHAAAP